MVKLIHKPFILLVSLILTALTLYYLFSSCDEQCISKLMKVEPGYYVAAIFFHLASYITRSLRLRLLLNNPDIPCIKLLSVLGVSGLATYIFPLKTGEITFPLLAKTHLNVPYIQSTPALFIARLFDLLAILFFVGVFSQSTLSQSIINYPGYSYFLAIIITSIAVFFLIKCIESPYFQRFSFVQKALEHSKQLSKKKLTQAFILSLTQWLLMALFFQFIAKAAGANLSLLAIMTITALILPLSLQPLQGIANTGPHEAAWLSVMLALGYSKKDALPVVISSHFLVLISISLLGLLGFILLSTQKLTR
ncbi:MAG: lysylphosphatidylglycerol synthase domain-containing protein [bacterium]